MVIIRASTSATSPKKRTSGHFWAPSCDWDPENGLNDGKIVIYSTPYSRKYEKHLTPTKQSLSHNSSPYNRESCSPSELVIRSIENGRRRNAVHEVNRSLAYAQLCAGIQNASLKSEAEFSQRPESLKKAFENLAIKEKEISRSVKRVVHQYDSNGQRELQEAVKRLKLYRAKVAVEQEAIERAKEEEHRKSEELKKQIEERKRNEEARHRKLLEEKELAAEQERKAKKVEEDKVKEKELVEEERRKEKKLHDQRLLDEQKRKDAEIARASEYLMNADDLALKLKRFEEKNVVMNASTVAQVKQQRLMVKKVVGEACNQISSKPSSVRLVTEKLSNLIDQAKSSGEDSLTYVLDFTAMKLVARCKCITESSACFPIAHVIKKLCLQHKELTDIILAHFFKICPFAIPKFRSKLKDETVVEYKRALGYEPDAEAPADSDGLESFTKFSDRMSLTVAQLAAIMQTPTFDDSPHPKGLGIEDAWAWLARVVNSEPNAFTASILLGFLEVASFELLRAYKRQFRKLLLLIEECVCPNLPRDAKLGSAPAAVRLDVFIQQYKAMNCTFSEPIGRQLTETTVSEADEERENGADHGGSGHYGGRGSYRGRGRGSYRGRGRGY